MPAEASGDVPKVILLGTGSEVRIAVAAREVLEAEGIPTRVVWLPCWTAATTYSDGNLTTVVPGHLQHIAPLPTQHQPSEHL